MSGATAHSPRAGSRGLLAPALLALALLTSFSACHKKTADGPRVRHSIDLRTLELLLLPEYRGLNLHTVHGELTRTVEGPADFGALMASTLTSSGFATDGGASGVRPPFTMSLARVGDTADFNVAFDIEPAKFADMVQVPTPLSTMDVGMVMPRGLKVVEERFRFTLNWEAATPLLAGQVTRLTTELLLSNQQWKARALPQGWGPKLPDGGLGAVPDDFALALDGLADGAVLTITRKGRWAELVYSLDTDLPAK